jgi:hypothetical protein
VAAAAPPALHIWRQGGAVKRRRGADLFVGWLLKVYIEH